MKNIKNIILCLAGIASFATSCQSILDEHPKTIYTPDYFTTQAGVEGGLTALYARLRYQNGNAYCFNIMTTGTDEATYAQSADGNFKIADMSGAGLLTPDNSNSGNYWTFTYINTANGIITNAEAVGLDASLIAEARFFRAFEYFNMVQIFGGVPLDLGSGELQFNTSPVRTSVRNTVPEVYTRCIFPDLKEAVTSLPDNPRLTGALTKTAARIVLSKAYLTYAWWLKNPKNIPTYPECDRVDPDGHDAAWYYQQAYDIALEAIANPGPFGLEDYYYKVFLGSNDRNKEQVLYADHTENSEQYNGASLSYGSGGNMDNFASWMLQWNYPNMKITNSEGAQVNPVLRTDNQFLGRPWTRMAPTQEALATFTHKDKDSRFDGTFTYIYRTNWTQGGNTYIPLKVNAAGVIPIIFASCLIYFPAQLAALFNVDWLTAFANAISTGWVNWILTVFLIVFFAYFYTSMVFNPEETADNLRKQGGFIPGVRPGSATVTYIKNVLHRVTLPGGIFIAIIAVVPSILFYFTNNQLIQAFGGTSILIMIGVALDTMSKVESQLKMHNYDGFFK